VFPAASNPPGFDRLQAVGARWVASSATWSTGFASFDQAGEAPSPAAVLLGAGYNAAASEGPSIGVVAEQDAAILYQRYTDLASPVGQPLTIAPESPANLILGGGGGESLIVWGKDGVMRARGVSAGGSPPAFEFGGGSIANYFTGSVAYSSPDFAIVWTGSPSPGAFATSFIKAGPGGPGGAPALIAESPFPHKTRKLTRTGAGYALLIQADLPTTSTLVLILDEEGSVVGPGRRFLGAAVGWDLAAQGDSLGLLAKRTSGEAQFRPLDATGAATGPWVCLTAPVDDLYHQAGLAAHGAGFAVVHRTPEGAEALVAIDKQGSPAP
jgi:hypothetical protein